MLALSEAATTGVFAVTGIALTTAGVIIVALISRDTRRQGEVVNRATSEFEVAWKQRGDLLDGLEADLAWTVKRLGIVEAREKECRERLTALETAVDAAGPSASNA